MAESAFFIALVVSSLLFLWACLSKPIFVLATPVAYSMITKIASVFFLDLSSSYISETQVETISSGASVRHVLYNVLILAFMAVGIAATRRLFPAPGKMLASGSLATAHSRPWRSVAVLFCFAAVAFQLSLIIASPPWPLPGSGIDRHRYWGSIFKYTEISAVFGRLVAFAPTMAGMLIGQGIFGRSKKLRNAGVLLAAFHFVYSIFCGQQFNGLLYALFLIFMPLALIALYSGQKVPIRKTLFLGSLALMSFLLFSSIDFGQRSIAQSEGGTVGGMAYRIFVLQGGVYYTADLGELQKSAHGHNLNLLFKDMDETLAYYMPADMSDKYSDADINLAGSLPGNAISALGYREACVPLAIYGLLLGVLMNLFGAAVMSGRRWSVIFCAYLMVWTWSVYARGSFATILTPQFAVFLILTLATFKLKLRPIVSPARFGHARRVTP